MATYQQSTPWQDIGGGYSFAALRVGMTIRNPKGAEVYVQPGDDTATMMDNIEALDEVSPDVDNPKRAIIADMMLGEYFA